MRDAQPCSVRIDDGNHPSYGAAQATRYWFPTPRHAHAVRELDARYRAAGSYESEGSEHRSLGSIPVAPVARWTATLTVPIPHRDVAFLQLERRGELPAGYRGAEESVLLSLPVGELGALIELLGALVAQARRDGVLAGE